MLLLNTALQMGHSFCWLAMLVLMLLLLLLSSRRIFLAMLPVSSSSSSADREGAKKEIRAEQDKDAETWKWGKAVRENGIRKVETRQQDQDVNVDV